MQWANPLTTIGAPLDHEKEEKRKKSGKKGEELRKEE